MKPKTRNLVSVSLLYWDLRRLFELVVLALRSERANANGRGKTREALEGAR
jgi:hypothetical protein